MKRPQAVVLIQERDAVGTNLIFPIPLHSQVFDENFICIFYSVIYWN